jgi:hypothetical protein
MAYCRTNIAHNNLRQTRKVSVYLEDKTHKRHLDLEIPQAKYFGLTTATTFERDVEMRRRSYQRHMRYRPGKKARSTTLWPIIRQPDYVTLTDKRWEELDDTIKLVLGIGVIAKVVKHIPHQEKPGRKGIPGPEYNILECSYRKMGPFIVPVRVASRSQRREIIQMVDQVTRRWNREKGAERIPEMSIMHMRRTGKDYRSVAEVLAQLEESAWAKANPTPTHKDAFLFPKIAILKDGRSALNALRAKGYEIKTAEEALPPLTPSAIGKKQHGKAKATPKAKLGYWWVRNPEWDAKQKQRSKKKTACQRRPRCMLDGLRLLCEARSIFRTRLRQKEQEWRLAQKATKVRLHVPEMMPTNQIEPTRVAFSPAKQANKEMSAAIKPPRDRDMVRPTVPVPPILRKIIRAAEICRDTPFMTAAQASHMLADMQYPVIAAQADPHWLQLGRHRLARNEALLAIQLACIRGTLLRSNRAHQAEFYFEACQGVECLTGGLVEEPLDAFDPCWFIAFEKLQKTELQDAWFDAVEDVAKMTNEHHGNPMEKTMLFNRRLAGQTDLNPLTAFLLTSVHFRFSDRPFHEFVNTFQRRLSLSDLNALSLPHVEAHASTPVLNPLPSQYPPLPKGCIPPSPFEEIEAKKQKAPEPMRVAGEIDPTVETKKKAQAKSAEQNTLRKPEMRRANVMESTDERKSVLSQPSAPVKPSEFQRIVLRPEDMILLVIGGVTAHDSPPTTRDGLNRFITAREAYIHAQDQSGETLVLRTEHLEAIVSRSALQLGIWLAIIDANLPQEACTKSEQRLHFLVPTEMPSTQYAKTCDQLIDVAKKCWQKVKVALQDDEMSKMWINAFHSSRDTEDGCQRAADIYGRLTQAGLDRNVVALLVLSQLGANIPLAKALIRNMGTVAKAPQVAREAPEPRPLER